MVRIIPIEASATWALRQRVLRPHQALAESRYENDERPGALHFGAETAAGIVGIASIYVEPEPGQPARADVWRLRGMATAPEVRGDGFGGRLLEACIAAARERGGDYLWCNARTTVQSFYAKHGFVTVGNVFELAGIGPHVVMRLQLRR